MTPEALAEIHARCFDVPRPWSAKEFSSLLESPNVFLIESANGFAMGRIAGPEAELLSIAVHPDSQSTGQGRKLLLGFIESAKQQSAKELFLEVAEINPFAIKLYESEGFAVNGRREGYYPVKNGPRPAAILMKKTI